MAYQALVLPVMIASPGDVNTERAIIRDVLHEWNDIHSSVNNVVLLPVGWETHSSPELGQPAQVLINERILKKCDLLVAVFWTRVGTPTLEEKSGTIVEIKKHIDAGKPAMVYFSSAPVAPEALDAQQYSELSAFKAWCKPKGLINSYENIEQFSNDFRRHIQIIINDNEYISNVISELSSNEYTENSINDYVEPEIIDSLNKDAINMLIAASDDPSGEIIKLPFIGGMLIQSNSIQFVESRNNPREVARWEAALSQLVQYNLVEAKGYKGQMFRVTALGYEIADKIKALDS